MPTTKWKCTDTQVPSRISASCWQTECLQAGDYLGTIKKTKDRSLTGVTAHQLCTLLFWGGNLSSSSARSATSGPSDSLWPHGLQPARLLCPWDSPGKNIEVGGPALLQGISLTREWNPHLLCCRWILELLSHQRVLSKFTSMIGMYVGQSINWMSKKLEHKMWVLSWDGFAKRNLCLCSNTCETLPGKGPGGGAWTVWLAGGRIPDKCTPPPTSLIFLSGSYGLDLSKPFLVACCRSDFPWAVLHCGNWRRHFWLSQWWGVC